MKNIKKIVNLINQKTKDLENSVKDTSKVVLNKYSDTKEYIKGKFDGTYYYPVNRLKRIDLDVQQGNIQIRQSATKQVKISLEVELYYDKTEFNKPEDAFYRTSILDIKNDILEIKVPNKKISVQLLIELPPITYQTVSAVVHQGNLQLEELKIQDLFIKNKIGNIFLNNLTSKLGQITNNVGNIYFNNSNINQLYITLTTGNVNFVGEFLSIKTNLVDGNIKIDKKNIKMSQVDLQVINGNIDLRLYKEVDFNLQTKIQNGQLEIDKQDLIISDNNFSYNQTLVAYTKKDTKQTINLNAKNGNIKLTR